VTGPVDIVIAAEHASDARHAVALIDRILTEEIGWLRDQPELVDSLRRWRGVHEAAPFMDIHAIQKIAEDRHLKGPHGHFDGSPAAHDYHSAVLMMRLLIDLELTHVLVWIRDTDGDRSRIQGWGQACESSGRDFKVLIGGFPHECMEAWLLAGWTPQSEDDAIKLRAERQRLGFNPIEQSHILSHKENVPKSAKQVQEALGVPDDVLLALDLDELQQRGNGCGLAEFINAIREQLVPALR
jgi:hypothetical protein